MIRRFLRSNPATPTETFSISGSPQALAISDTGAAWTIREPADEHRLLTRQVGATSVPPDELRPRRDLLTGGLQALPVTWST